MEKGHIFLFISFLLVAAIAAAGCTGTSPALNNSSTTVTPTPAPVSYSVNLTADEDYLYLSLPAAGADDSMTVTAHVYADGVPVKAGVPVAFSLKDDSLAKLSGTTNSTDNTGAASIIVTAKQPQDSSLIPSSYPYYLTVMASADGANGSLATPMSRHESLSGKAIDKEGNVVSGATVTLRFNATNLVVRAPGNPTITNGDGRYNFTSLPVDLGNIRLVVQKGGLTTTLPVNFTTSSKNTP